MNERLLQFIWQFQYFNNMELQTTDHEHVTVIQPGKLNTNQGPDFLEAKVRIGDNIWVGNVELHIYTSDWIKHRHDGDKNYANVILHVVWRTSRNNVIFLRKFCCKRKQIFFVAAVTVN